MLITRALPTDVADFLRQDRPRLTVPERLYRHVVIQVAAGDTWSVRASPENPPLALYGIYRFGDRPSQVWFMCVPETSKRMARVGVAMRDELRRQAPLHPGVVAWVRSPVGARLARAFGFVLVDIEDGLQLWRYADGDGQEPLRRPHQQCSAHAADDGGAA